MASESISFSILDYTLFALTLSISALIGIFYAILGWRRGEGVEAFLTGSRRMPLLPTAISLIVSFVSGISIISYPAQVYTNGLVFMWTTVGAALAPIISGILILPVLRRVQNSLSIYAYFEYRFGSKALRIYGAFLYQITNVVYISVVLYAPSVALAGVTGIDIRVLISSVGLICTLYTSMGGLKAVVWSDCFQAIIMYVGLVALAIQGTMGTGGGVTRVFQVARNSGRLHNMINMDPNPLQYMTVWTGVFGGLFYWLPSFASDQSAMQRYQSLPTLKMARIAIFFNVPLMILIMFLIIFIGLTMIPKYVACDPRLTDGIGKDQILIFYMMQTLSSIYGLPGLFLACIFSGTLSSVSAGINALSAVFLEDFVKPVMRKTKRPLTDRQATLITKITGAMYGLMAVGLAFVAGPLGGIFKTVMSVSGALSGPLVGMLLLGILFPCANRLGALIGALIANAVSLWIFIGCTIHGVTYPELPVSTDGCLIHNSTSWNQTVEQFSFSERLFSPELHGIEKLYAISYIMYPCISACLTILIGLGISMVTGRNGKGPQNLRLTYWENSDS